MTSVIAGAITALRNLVTSIDPAVGDDKAKLLVEAVKQVTGTIEAIGTTVDQHSSVIAQVHQQINQVSAQQQIMQQQQMTAPPHSAGRKPLAESKCISNLKILGSDKSEFKNWNEKLINATTQTFGSEWRKFMKELNEKLDIDRKVLSDVEINALPSALQVTDPDKCSE